MPSTNHLDDVQLFSELSYWLVQQMERPTYGNYLDWLGHWTSAGSPLRLRLMRLLRLTDPKTEEAEEALIAWLGRSHRTVRERRRVTESIDNRVDWPRTWAMKEGNIPFPYHTQKPAPFPPEDLERALAELARSWCRRLDIFVQDFGQEADLSSLRVALKHRADALRSVRRGGGSTPYTSRHSQYLIRLGGEHRNLALKIQAVERFLQRRIRSEKDEVIATVAKDLKRAATDEKELNVNDLLEATATIAIAKAATQLNPEVRVFVGAPETNSDAYGQKKPDLYLRWPSGLNCKIYKGYPRSGGKREGSTDLLRPTFARWGFNSSGLQPDIILTFEHQHVPREQLTVLGDAKRTTREDGSYVGASIHNAVRYVVAYHRELNAKLQSGDELFSAPLHPLYTLFVFAPKDPTVRALKPTSNDWLHIHYLGQDFGPGDHHSTGLHTWINTLTERAEAWFDDRKPLGSIAHPQASAFKDTTPPAP